MRRLIIILLAVYVAACGDAASPFTDDVVTQAPPYISRVDPAGGPAGTAISIYGFGFSVNVPQNIVIVGDQSVAAESYELLTVPTSDEIERLTATVPTGLPAGDSSVVVVVNDNASNADILFTVTP